MYNLAKKNCYAWCIVRFDSNRLSTSEYLSFEIGVCLDVTILWLSQTFGCPLHFWDHWKALMKQCGNLLFLNFQTKAKVIQFSIVFIAEN